MNITEKEWKVKYCDDDPYGDIKIVGDLSDDIKIETTICKLSLDDAPVHDYNARVKINARLISYAPKMYHTLKRICDDCDFSKRYCVQCSINTCLKNIEGNNK